MQSDNFALYWEQSIENNLFYWKQSRLCVNSDADETLT